MSEKSISLTEMNEPERVRPRLDAGAAAVPRRPRCRPGTAPGTPPTRATTACTTSSTWTRCRCGRPTSCSTSGAGPATSPPIVAALVPDGEVVGVDPQPTLLDEARRRAAPNQRFVQGAVQQLGALFPVAGSFDVVMTRAVLQWVPLADHPGVLADAFRLLRPGGWYRAEFGGAGNIPVILRLLDDVAARLGGPQCPWTFADVGPYLELVEQAGFDLDGGFLRLTPQRRHFDRETLMGWFHSQAVQAYTTTMDAEAGAAFVRGVESRFDELARWDGTFDQTFVRMDLLARRPA